MARRTQLALQRQLKRERAHLQWLEQHLPQSTQLSSSKVRAAKLALQSLHYNVQHAMIRDKKALQVQRFFLTHTSNCVAQHTLHLL